MFSLPPSEFFDTFHLHNSIFYPPQHQMPQQACFLQGGHIIRKLEKDFDLCATSSSPVFSDSSKGSKGSLRSKCSKKVVEEIFIEQEEENSESNDFSANRNSAEDQDFDKENAENKSNKASRKEEPANIGKPPVVPKLKLGGRFGLSSLAGCQNNDPYLEKAPQTRPVLGDITQEKMAEANIQNSNQ